MKTNWTVSICQLHDAPLFQPHNGCDCDLKDTMMARRVEVVESELTTWLAEALEQLADLAEEARGHYGIEECAGPAQPSTEWDDIQDGLQLAALDARAALDVYGDNSPSAPQSLHTEPEK